MRARLLPDSNGVGDDFPWADLFCSEIDAWTPDRLAAHFQPRAKQPGLAAAMVLPSLAVAVAIVMIGTLVYAVLPRSALPNVINAVLGTTSSPAPTQAPRVKPSNTNHGPAMPQGRTIGAQPAGTAPPVTGPPGSPGLVATPGGPSPRSG